AVNYLKGEKSFNESTWANYFRHGSYGNDETTFYKDVLQLKAGHYQVYKSGKLLTTKWYHFNTTGYDGDDNNLIQKFDTLLKKAVGYRFVSDVPVGVNLSGGIDSSALTYLTTKENPLINAFTFYTGDERYDELPWVEKLLENTRVAWHKVKLSSQEIPDLANKISQIQDEPFGGIPTLAYAKLFQEAKHLGIKVVLDGQGMDEQLGGYDYYYKQGQSVVQGATSRATIPEACLLDVEQTKEQVHLTFKDELLQKQYIDLFHKKLPRALRFNDRISMASSVELREPFLDHNLVEWSFHLPLIYKYANHKTKALLRSYLSQKLPGNIVEAPKRPLQTPQREWLRNELKEWSVDMINVALTTGWLNKTVVEKEMQHFWQGKSDNSFYIWQWINLGLLVNETR
ncbi:MAG: asparagine synthase (glutamine-hydrolyzing), partial [Glaciecola sp.]